MNYQDSRDMGEPRLKAGLVEGWPHRDRLGAMSFTIRRSKAPSLALAGIYLKQMLYYYSFSKIDDGRTSR